MACLHAVVAEAPRDGQDAQHAIAKHEATGGLNPPLLPVGSNKQERVSRRVSIQTHPHPHMIMSWLLY